MKYVILAAGRGTRLSPLTDDRHKGLVEYKGKSILFHFMDYIKDTDEVMIILGHRADELREAIEKRYPSMNLHFVLNPEYETTGTANSLWYAKDFAKSGFVYGSCDFVPDARMMEELDREGSIIFVDQDKSFRNTMVKFSQEAAEALFSLQNPKHERAYDRMFKIMGHQKFHTMDITGMDWKEIDEPNDLL